MSKSNSRAENLALLREGLTSILENDDHGLRDRQHEALLKLATSEGDEFYQGYFNQATGIGKTYEMATLIRAFRSVNREQKTIVLEEFIDMVEQTANAFGSEEENEYLGEGLDVIGRFNTNHKDVDKPIIVTTYASLKNLIKEIDVNTVGLIVPDEAHRALSDARRENIKAFPNALVYAFTATPKFDEKKHLRDLLKNELDELSIEEGIKQGLNCSVKNILLVSDVAVDLSQIKRTGGDYDDAEFNKAVGVAHKDKIKDSIVEFWAKFADVDTGERAQNRITMINCRNLDEARAQAEAFNKYFGKTVAKAYGSELSNKEKEETLKGFEKGDFPVICQVGTLGEGYNYPELSLCINYPTSSIVREAQRSGRPLRLDPNNRDKKAWVVDVVFRHPNHIDDPITIAAEKNNQVLFGHVLGKLEINSKERDSFEKILKNKRAVRGEIADTLNLRGFSVISSTQELFEISQSTDIWNREHFIPNKTEDMKVASELGQIYIGQIKEILLHMKKLEKELLTDSEGNLIKDSNGDDIPLILKARSGQNIGLVLNGTGDRKLDNLIIASFESKTGLERKIVKTKYMRTTLDLKKEFAGNQSKFIEKLKMSEGEILKDEKGNIIKDKDGNDIPIVKKVQSGSGKPIYVLNGIGDEKIDNLIEESFIKSNKIKRKGSLIYRNEYMRTAENLKGIYIGSAEAILNKLKENVGKFLTDENGNLVKDVFGNNIPIVQKAKNLSGREGTFLNGTGDKNIDGLIEELFEKESGLERKGDVPDKNMYMMDAIEATSNYYVGAPSKIIVKLRDTYEKVLKDDSDAFIVTKEGKIPLVQRVKGSTNTSCMVLNLTGDEGIDKEIVNKFGKINDLQIRSKPTLTAFEIARKKMINTK